MVFSWIVGVSAVGNLVYVADQGGCPDEETCGLRLAMGDVRNAIADILDNTSLADVTKRQNAVRKKLGIK